MGGWERLVHSPCISMYWEYVNRPPQPPIRCIGNYIMIQLKYSPIDVSMPGGRLRIYDICPSLSSEWSIVAECTSTTRANKWIIMEVEYPWVNEWMQAYQVMWWKYNSKDTWWCQGHTLQSQYSTRRSNSIRVIMPKRGWTLLYDGDRICFREHIHTRW